MRTRILSAALVAALMATAAGCKIPIYATDRTTADDDETTTDDAADTAPDNGTMDDTATDDAATGDATTCSSEACAHHSDCCDGSNCVAGACTPFSDALPPNEVCNGLDDNGDGNTDEGCPPSDDIVAAGDDDAADDDTGGDDTGGDVAGDDDAAPTEACNDLDDDGDGATDEGCPPDDDVVAAGDDDTGDDDAVAGDDDATGDDDTGDDDVAGDDDATGDDDTGDDDTTSDDAGDDDAAGCASNDDCALTESCLDGACAPDADRDTVPDADDNCPAVANYLQEDADDDGLGDACDDDTDTGDDDTTGDDDAAGDDDVMAAGDDDTGDDDTSGCASNDDCAFTESCLDSTCVADADRDTLLDADDNCPDTANYLQEDGDADTVGDACDNCPAAANVDQADADSDDVGDACESPSTLPTEIVFTVTVPSDVEVEEPYPIFCTTIGGWNCRAVTLGGADGRTLVVHLPRPSRMTRYIANVCTARCEDPINGVWLAVQLDGEQPVALAPLLAELGTCTVPTAAADNERGGANYAFDLAPYAGAALEACAPEDEE